MDEVPLSFRKVRLIDSTDWVRFNIRWTDAGLIPNFLPIARVLIPSLVMEATFRGFAVTLGLPLNRPSRLAFSKPALVLSDRVFLLGDGACRGCLAGVYFLEIPWHLLFFLTEFMQPSPKRV